MCLIVLAVIVFLFRARKKLFEKERLIQIKEREKEIAAFKAAADAEERQKEKIAGDLHDGVIQLLTTIVQNTNSNIKDFETGRLSVDNMKSDRDTAIQLIDTIRSIAFDLVPDILLNYGLEKAIAVYVKKLNNDNCTVTVEKLADFEVADNFEKKDEVNIYRLCQELINNLTKHDPFSMLRIIFSRQNDNFIIEFVHDGIGVTNAEINFFRETASGHGLKSLQSRSLMLNAKIDYSKSPESSTIKVFVPFIK